MVEEPLVSATATVSKSPLKNLPRAFTPSGVPVV